jgi:hypothetical protein
MTFHVSDHTERTIVISNVKLKRKLWAKAAMRPPKGWKRQYFIRRRWNEGYVRLKTYNREAMAAIDKEWLDIYLAKLALISE